MILTAEEEIMVDVMHLYARNTAQSRLDFSEYVFDEQQLWDTIRRCKNAGIIASLIDEGKIINFPSSILEGLDGLRQIGIWRESWLKYFVAQLTNYARKLSAKSIIGGSYAVAKDLCGEGEILVDELVVYLDKDIDLSHFSKTIRITKVLKDESFFDDYYSNCIRVNFAPIDVLYNDALAALSAEREFNHKHITAHILHSFYAEKIRLIPFIKSSLSHATLDGIFEAKRV